MKSLDILSLILKDAHSVTCAHVSRDLKTIESRIEHEGQSFLTITLPTFSNWLVMSLERGFVETEISSKFRLKTKRGKKSVLPCFLHGLTSLVFDATSGLIKENPDINAIRFIWQIGNTFKKTASLCTEKRIKKAISNYVATDLSLKKKSIPFDPSFLECSRLITGEVSKNLDLSSCVPKHGPGATSDGRTANQKFTSRVWYKRWSNLFSWEDLYGFMTIDPKEWMPPLSSAEEPPVKVVPVPKTMKTPRIISIESTSMQYAQQYLSSAIIQSISRCSFARQIDINNQSTNANLALASSLTREYATIDLSDASDLVSCKLVANLFGTNRYLRDMIFALRSHTAKTPDGISLKLTKFASMGSALTFPIETLCFFAIASSAVADWRWSHISEGLTDPLTNETGKSWKSICKSSLQKTFVYGDDILVPSDAFSFVVAKLEAFLLKVNRNKSFSKGYFRESCGTDAYGGVSISPTYVRRISPTTIDDIKEVISFVKTANLAYKAGLWHLSFGMKDWFDRNIRKLPYQSEETPLLAWFSYLGSDKPTGWDEFLHVPTISGFSPRVISVSDEISDDDALLKTLLSLESKPSNHDSYVMTAKDHLVKSASRYKLALHRQKVMAR